MAPRTEAFPRSTLGPVHATVLLLAVPLAGLVLLLLEPGADAHWQHRPTHFWLILATGLVNVVLDLAASEAARRRGVSRAPCLCDARPTRRRQEHGLRPCDARRASARRVLRGPLRGRALVVSGRLGAPERPVAARRCARRDRRLGGRLAGGAPAVRSRGRARGPPLGADRRCGRRMCPLRLRDGAISRSLPAPRRRASRGHGGGLGAPRRGAR